MNKKRNLLDELDIPGLYDSIESPLDISTNKIKAMVNDKIASAYTERKIIMKSKKKFALISAAAVFILSISVFAASSLITSWDSHSSSIPEYTSLPTAKQCMDDVGYVPKLIESFENGYSFINGSVIDNVLKDDSNSSVEKFKSISFRYEKDGDKLHFSQDKYNSTIVSHGDVIASVGDIDIYYYNYTNKIVPGDYKLTEEDKKAEENGELVFSYGSENIEISKVQSVSWVENDIHYNMMQIDGELSPQELTDMAKEAIEE